MKEEQRRGLQVQLFYYQSVLFSEKVNKLSEFVFETRTNICA